MRCIIVDDEYLSVYLLKTYSLRCPNLQLLATFTDSEKAQAFLLENEVDLILTDIQMPILSGLDLVRNAVELAQNKQLPTAPIVIFTTANPQYAVQAFELRVVDFLVKPVPFLRFEAAIAHAEKQFLLQKRGEKQTETDVMSYLSVKSNYQTVRIEIAAIDWIEVQSEYVYIHVGSEKTVTVQPLKKVLMLLPSADFVQIHKSFVVARRAILRYNATTVTLQNGTILPIGRRFKTAI